MKLTDQEIAVLRRKFGAQKDRAGKRGIRFELTFEEWLKIWVDSGKLPERGTAQHQYCMSRNGPDIGPYKVGNVTIKTNAENNGEIVQPSDKSARMSAINKGVPKSDAHRAKMCAAAKLRGPAPDRSKAVFAAGIQYKSMTEAGKALGVDRVTVLNRIKRGDPGYRYVA